MSGYAIKITAFLPCGKDAQSHIAAYMKFRQAVVWLSENGFAEIELHNEFKPNRKPQAQDVDSITGCADDQGICKSIPAPAPLSPATEAQESTAPEAKHPPDAASEAGDAPTREECEAAQAGVSDGDLLFNDKRGSRVADRLREIETTAR